MDFSIATVLSHFVDDKLVAAKVLEKKLDFQEEQDGERLQIILDILEKLGVLVKERGKYRRVYQDDVIEAKLRCSSKGFCFAIQDLEDADDIYIRESHLSNAWNGDRVLVKIIKEGSRRRSPEGEVKVILERANPSLLARVIKDNEDYRAIPLDDRLLFELDLEESETLPQSVDHLVHVTVRRYPIAQFPPLGEVTKILGSDAEEAADTDIVCCKHDLPYLFPEGLQAEIASWPDTIEPSELERRRDLRELFTITIENDPDQALLVENAFTLEQTEAGNWCLGIHITDVAHYVKQNTLLDQTAKKRGSAIYLGDLKLPLFPESIKEKLSLIPDKDCLALSIFITIDENGSIIESDICESVITVNQALSFSEVQTLLGEETETTPLTQLLNNLFFNLSPLVKTQRLQRGGFSINLAEAQSAYLDEGRLGAIVIDSSLPVRSLLTELMVLGGKVVADHFVALALPGIYCSQPEPDFDELEDVIKLGVNLGLAMGVESEEDITPQDFQNFTREFSQSPAVRVLNYLLHSTLKPIHYSSHPSAHFGLAYSDCYTHCVSPARRYADLFVQRILKALFEHGRDRRNSLSKKGVELGHSSCHGQINWNVFPPQVQTDLEEGIVAIIPHLNDREKVALDAEKDLQGLKKAEKMKERTGKIFQGLITGVQSYGFFVEIEDLLVEGLVHVSSLKDDWYEYRSRQSCLVGRKNRIAYRLGDLVEVEVKSVDYYRQQIDLATVRGGSSLLDDDLEDE
jgi:ribonuclease R